MEEYVYVLREDMYNEWAWENGATNLISVSHNLDIILKDLRKHLVMEKLLVLFLWIIHFQNRYRKKSSRVR